MKKVDKENDRDSSLSRKSVALKELHGNPVNVTKDQDWNRGSYSRLRKGMIILMVSTIAFRMVVL